MTISTFDRTRSSITHILITLTHRTSSPIPSCEERHDMYTHVSSAGMLLRYLLAPRAGLRDSPHVLKPMSRPTFQTEAKRQTCPPSLCEVGVDVTGIYYRPHTVTDWLTYTPDAGTGKSKARCCLVSTDGELYAPSDWSRNSTSTSYSPSLVNTYLDLLGVYHRRVRDMPHQHQTTIKHRCPQSAIDTWNSHQHTSKHPLREMKYGSR